MKYNELKKEMMKDPKFAKEYRKPDYEILIGRMLYELRVHLGLNQKDFAKKIGKTQSAVARWESGNYLISLRTLIEIADKLDTVLIPPAFGRLRDPISYKRFKK